MKKDIDGILLLNKTLSISSNTALQKVKRLFQANKAGHTGSLDPLATGMLPICFGQATKYSQFLLDADKCYQVTGRLGQSTTTGDAEGPVIKTVSDFNVTEAQLQTVIKPFIGEITQSPSLYSALKYQGKPLYTYAREGIAVPKKVRKTTLFDITLTHFDGRDFTIVVLCAKGTYMRTLIEDIGNALGLGAYVTKLHRLYSFPYQNNRMYSYDELEKVAQSKGYHALIDYLLPIDAALNALPSVTFDQLTCLRLSQGQKVKTPCQIDSGKYFRVYDEADTFYGVAYVNERDVLEPKRMLSKRVSA